MTPIYHIADAAAWRAAADSGAYRPPSLAAEGFIHLSTRDQVLGTAARFYAGRADLVVLVVDPGGLGPALRYEPPAHAAGEPEGALFPHLYGSLPVAAVVGVTTLVLGPDGQFAWPA